MYNDFKPRRRPSEAQTELMDKLSGEIGKSTCKAVSFKMFDALVLMPFSGDGDLFAFMEDEFKRLCPDSKKTFTELRTAAQEAALKKMNVLCRVNLKFIYSIFRKLADTDDETADKLFALECELAEKYSFPRDCGKALYRQAKDARKRVIITAETIYPEDTVRDILEKCGYGSYDGLIMTSQIKNCTGESYFPEVLAAAGVKAEKLVHIGSDIAFDIELPIYKGAKALLISNAAELMASSGRVRGYAEDKKLFDYDDRRFLALRCVFGLYAAYGFGTPQKKKPMSDFCGDEYNMGFLVLGALSLDKDTSPLTEFQSEILSALEKNPRIMDGKNDFTDMFEAHFGSSADLGECEGCRLPLEFLENCCAADDRGFISEHLSEKSLKKWSKSVKEPDIVRFSHRKLKKSPLSKLADKMFPPGTRVRNIVDGILAKWH